MDIFVNQNRENKIFTNLFVLLFGFFYCILPLFLTDIYPSNVVFRVSIMMFIGLLGYWIGLNVHRGRQVKTKKLEVDFSVFSNYIFIFFVLIVLIVIITSKSVPILDSLSGKSTDELILAREEFLKKREGWESYLAYFVSNIDTTFLPFVIVYSFYVKSKKRFIFLLIFLLYSISFLEKAYFFKVAIPLFMYFFYVSKNKKKFLIISLSILFSFLMLMFALSGFSQIEVIRDEPFFSIMHIPDTVYGTIFWRSVGVPVATVIDAVKIFGEDYDKLFYGATSSFIASITGQERINFERIVYFYQFGGGGTGNANQAYFVEAFVNFGYIGIFIFSVMVGKFVYLLLKTKNIAYISIIPLFLYNLFNAGLIGNLLSSGFLLFFIFVKFVKIK